MTEHIFNTSCVSLSQYLQYIITCQLPHIKLLFLWPVFTHHINHQPLTHRRYVPWLFASVARAAKRTPQGSARNSRPLFKGESYGVALKLLEGLLGHWLVGKLIIRWHFPTIKVLFEKWQGRQNNRPSDESTKTWSLKPIIYSRILSVISWYGKSWQYESIHSGERGWQSPVSSFYSLVQSLRSPNLRYLEKCSTLVTVMF